MQTRNRKGVKGEDKTPEKTPKKQVSRQSSAKKIQKSSANKKESKKETKLSPPKIVLKDCEAKSPTQINNSDQKNILQPPSPQLSRKSSKSIEDVIIQPKQFVLKKQGRYTDKYINKKEVLGEGGMALVYKVYLKENQSITRALKQIKKADLKSYEINQFTKEIELLKNLDHPVKDFFFISYINQKIIKLKNIVKIYEFYEDDLNYQIVTELCEGKDLLDTIYEKDSWTEEEAAEIMKQVFLALTYSHKSNIVHRDIKPDNILVYRESQTSNYQVKLIDWGVATHYNSKSQELLTQLYGSIYYLAPEVIEEKYNEKCDIWSAGVVMYVMLGQDTPFKGETQSEIFQSIKSKKNYYLSQIRQYLNKKVGKYCEESLKEISDEGKDLIRKLLTKDPSKRISAQDALKHVWFQTVKVKKNTLSNEKAIKNLDNFKKFKLQSKIQEAAISYIASHLTTMEERKDLSKLFSMLDKNGDGLLSQQEIVDGYQKIFEDDEQIAQEDALKIFQAVDTDKSGFIDYNEFIAACLDKREMFSESRLKQAFKLFDKDGDGFIDSDEIEHVLGGQLSEIDKKVWDDIVKEVDENGDGVISYQEFVKIMKKLSGDEKNSQIIDELSSSQRSASQIKSKKKQK